MSREFTCIILLLILSDLVSADSKITVMALFRDAIVVRIEGHEQLLRAGGPAVDGIRLISADSNQAVLEVNGVSGVYTLNSVISGSYNHAQTPRTVTIAPDSQGMYRVNGSIEGFQVEFMIDTGATFISMNRNHAKRLGIDFKSTGQEGISNTASGKDAVYTIELDRVVVGEISLRDVQAVVHDGEFPDVILLGNSFLQRVSMRRDGALMLLYDRY